MKSMRLFTRILLLILLLLLILVVQKDTNTTFAFMVGRHGFHQASYNPITTYNYISNTKSYYYTVTKQGTTTTDTSETETAAAATTTTSFVDDVDDNFLVIANISQEFSSTRSSINTLRIAWDKYIWNTTKTKTTASNDNNNNKEKEILELFRIGQLSSYLRIIPKTKMTTALVEQNVLSDSNDANILLEWKVLINKSKNENNKNRWGENMIIIILRPIIEIIMKSILNHLHGAISTLPPKLLTRTFYIVPKTSTPLQNDNKHTTNKQQEFQQQLQTIWMDYIWKQGGGLPILPPIPLNNNHNNCNRRMYLPIFLIEEVTDIIHNNNSSTNPLINEIHYRVQNPGWLTFYPVYTHRGRVQFINNQDDDTIQIIWQVEIRPYNNKMLQWFVQTFTEAVVTTLSRNFIIHVQIISSSNTNNNNNTNNDDNAYVLIRPPRGKGQSFTKIKKDTWLGGVLYAHIHDQRTTIQQSISLLQPWTWGWNDNNIYNNHIIVNNDNNNNTISTSTTWSDSYLFYR